MTVTDRDGEMHGPVELATRQELNAAAVAPQAPILYAAAIAIAVRLDETTAARDTAALARELRATLADIRATIKPVEVKADPVDDLASRRSARRSAAASGS